MEIVLSISLVVVLLGTTAGMLLALPASWEGVRPQWLRASPEARRRGVIGGLLSVAASVVAATLAIAAPWGNHSVLYVMAGVGGIGIVLVHVAVIGEVVHTKKRRRHSSAPSAERSDSAYSSPITDVKAT